MEKVALQVAVDTARESTADSGVGARPTHRGDCRCVDCPNSAPRRHRQARAAFRRRRDDLAEGIGVPAALAHSPGASRQWVSDELVLASRSVADGARAESAVRTARLRQRTLYAVWGAVVLLLAVQTLTAVGDGWTRGRTAALLAAVLLAGAATAAGLRHREAPGLPTLLTGRDNRFSTSRTVAACWMLLTAFAVLMTACRLALTPDAAERRDLLDLVAVSTAAGTFTALALGCAAAVLAQLAVARGVARQRLQKVPADRPRAADLLTDDDGRGSFTDAQYVLVNAVVLGFAGTLLARRPEQVPHLPWALPLLLAVSAAVYLAAKHTGGGRPVVLSVVRAREAGDLDAPIRTGDDIEIRGSGFVPPGGHTPDRLARTVVRIGTVHVHVPLVPVVGGFVNPADTVLTVPVPADVEPGRLDVQVVTPAGAESNRCTIDVME